ncbi:hypothetical protein F5Y08DRAFT_355423 [Xylaria arbuscula]|nr:hypothetical protein F5Y08DRAFT_355423 [Xylaria arbuscula]
MHISSFFLTAAASAAAVAATGYQVNPNMESGIYFVPRLTKSGLFQRSGESYGHPIHVTDVDTSIPPDDIYENGMNGTLPLPIDELKCVEATEDPWSHDGAKATLVKWCDEDRKIPATENWGYTAGILIARHGSSVAYACNFGKKQGCAGDEIEDAWAHIQNKCGGPYEGGQVCMKKKWKKCYGHSTVTAMICDNTRDTMSEFGPGLEEEVDA